MPWTNKQKAAATRACEAIGMDRVDRLNALRNTCGADRAGHLNALFDSKGRAVAEPTSTSLRLNESDFESFMALIETASRGRIQTKDTEGNFIYSFGYWNQKAAIGGGRKRALVITIYDTLVLEGHLQGDGVGLAGWIRDRVTGGRTDQLDELQPHEMSNLIEGLKAFAKRHGLTPKRSLQEA